MLMWEGVFSKEGNVTFFVGQTKKESVISIMGWKEYNFYRHFKRKQNDYFYSLGSRYSVLLLVFESLFMIYSRIRNCMTKKEEKETTMYGYWLDTIHTSCGYHIK